MKACSKRLQDTASLQGFILHTDWLKNQLKELLSFTRVPSRKDGSSANLSQHDHPSSSSGAGSGRTDHRPACLGTPWHLDRSPKTSSATVVLLVLLARVSSCQFEDGLLYNTKISAAADARFGIATNSRSGDGVVMALVASPVPSRLRVYGA